MWRFTHKLREKFEDLRKRHWGKDCHKFGKCEPLDCGGDIDGCDGRCDSGGDSVVGADGGAGGGDSAGGDGGSDDGVGVVMGFVVVVVM